MPETSSSSFKTLRLSVLSALAFSTLVLACSSENEPETSAAYDRALFGRWADNDGNCRNTRHEMLAGLSTVPVQTTVDGCRITHGQWYDPYTGQTETEARDLDVDHMVPLAWAWAHGADKWSKERRRRFANDPVNLVPTDAGINRGKGADGPDDWLPPHAPYQCAYVLRFIRIARSYDLELERDEAREIAGIRDRACS